MHGVLKEICRASLIEPTYEEFEDAGIRLTDDQMMAIFSYSQKGVKALESFRQKPGNLNVIGLAKEFQKTPAEIINSKTRMMHIVLIVLVFLS